MMLRPSFMAALRLACMAACLAHPALAQDAPPGVSQDVPKDLPPPGAPSTVPAPAPAAPSQTQAAPPEPVAPSGPKRYAPFSIFFSADEREAIAQAKKAYLERDLYKESEQDLLDQLQGIKDSKRQEEDLQEKFYAQFYLETLIYHTPNDWTVWVKENDASKKYTPTHTSGASDMLKVIAIRKEDVTFEWKPKNWNYVSGKFKAGNPALQIDTARQLVMFTLRVNQTMSSNEMDIKEGVVQAVPMEGAAQQAATPGAVPGQPAAAVPSVMRADKPKSGGVLGLYKNIESPDKQPQDNAPAAPSAAP